MAQLRLLLSLLQEATPFARHLDISIAYDVHCWIFPLQTDVYQESLTADSVLSHESMEKPAPCLPLMGPYLEGRDGQNT